MNVCVIGTSNSIYENGYTGGIRDHVLVSNVDKFSLGASPSTIIPYFIEKINFSNYDLVVFETGINDRNYYKYGAIGKKQIRENLEYGIYKATKSGCLVSLLLMPVKKLFNKETIAKIIYSKVAAETGALYVNGYDYVQGKLGYDDAFHSDFFIDDFHLRKDFAHKLGGSLIDEVASGLNLCMIKELKHKFVVFDLSDYAKFLVNRKTSIASDRFSIIKEGEEIKIPLKIGDKIVGYGYNAAKTSAMVSFKGDNEVIKKTSSKYFTDKKDLLLLISPVVSEPNVNIDGNLFLSVSASGAKETEPSRFDKWMSEETLGYLEISKLIVKRKA